MAQVQNSLLLLMILLLLPTVAVAGNDEDEPGAGQSTPQLSNPVDKSRDPLLGTWHLRWQGASHYYTGELIIDNKDGSGYSGKLILRFGNNQSVTQNARITTRGNSVMVRGSRPSAPNWSPDNFTLTLDGDKMTGNSKDTSGRTGQWIELKRTK